MRTRQEAFDIIYAHALSMKEKSTFSDKNGVCAYRGQGGNKCFIGVLIPDEEYKESFERRGVAQQSEDGTFVILSAAGLSEEDLAFACELQDIHDLNTKDSWAWFLAAFAKDHGLEVPAQ